MLVCSVVLRPQRHTVEADVVEIAEALDNPGSGTIFVTLTDDPGNARDLLDAFVGQRIVEAANAADVVDAGSAHPASLLEEISAAVAAQDASLTSFRTWATWEPASVASVTLSGSNLIATNTGKNSPDQGAQVSDANAKTTGKYYFEATFITITGGPNLGVGIGTTASTYTGIGSSATVGDHGYQAGAIWANGANTGTSVGAYSNGQITGIAVDLDNRKAWFRHAPSGNWNNSGTANPASNIGGIAIPAGAMVPFVTFGGTPGGAANNVVAGNFGGSAFSGTVPAGFIAGWPVSIVGTVTEAASAVAVQDATKTAAAAVAALDGALVDPKPPSTLIGTEVPDSGPITVV
jgi:hypothetical protein